MMMFGNSINKNEKQLNKLKKNNFYEDNKQ